MYDLSLFITACSTKFPAKRLKTFALKNIFFNGSKLSSEFYFKIDFDIYSKINITKIVPYLKKKVLKL